MMVGQKAAFMQAEAEYFLLLTCNEMRCELLEQTAQREHTKPPSNLAQAVTLPSCVVDVPGSNVDHDTDYLHCDFLVVLLSHSRRIPR
jgi:hypothetical protein